MPLGWCICELQSRRHSVPRLSFCKGCVAPEGPRLCTKLLNAASGTVGALVASLEHSQAHS